MSITLVAAFLMHIEIFHLSCFHHVISNFFMYLLLLSWHMPQNAYHIMLSSSVCNHESHYCTQQSRFAQEQACQVDFGLA